MSRTCGGALCIGLTECADFSVTELVDLTSVCWPRPGTACGLLLASSFPPLWRYALSGWIEVGDDDFEEEDDDDEE